jgi:lipopolysaccharide/colanic/teichoic acid biosynthesis glycosyltransferase
MNGRFMSDSERLTRLGKILRSSSLDELPTLWNVIIGDMSLVGPRPLLVEYIPLYNKMQARRHNVKPGVTGWAQINGRNALSWQDKFKLDVWYTKNQSFLLDFKILLMTFRKVITLDGIGEKGQLTVSKFKGNKN